MNQSPSHSFSRPKPGLLLKVLTVIAGLFLLLPGCRGRTPVESSEDRDFSFSTPYSETSKKQSQKPERNSPRIDSSLASCASGKKRARQGARLIRSSANTVSNVLRRKQPEQPYMSFLYTHETALRKSGKTRKQGIKKLVNGLYVLLHTDRIRKYRSSYEKIDTLLAKEKKVADATEEKRNGLLSDFKGIYTGLKKLAGIQKKLVQQVRALLNKYDCNQRVGVMGHERIGDESRQFLFQ